MDFQWSYSVPGVNDTVSAGLLDAGAGVTIQYTNRDTVSDLYGTATNVGASVGDLVYGGVDLVSFSNPNEIDAEIDGFQFTIGIGAGVDVHLNVTDTKPVHIGVLSTSSGVVGALRLNQVILKQ